MGTITGIFYPSSPRTSQRPIEGRRAVRRSEVPPRSSSGRVGQMRAIRRPPSCIRIWEGHRSDGSEVESCHLVPSTCRGSETAHRRRGAFCKKIFRDPSSVVGPPSRGSFVLEPPLISRSAGARAPGQAVASPSGRSEAKWSVLSRFLSLSSFFLPFPGSEGGSLPLFFLPRMGGRDPPNLLREGDSMRLRERDISIARERTYAGGPPRR